MTKKAIFGFFSLFLFVKGAEGAGKVREDQSPALQAPQFKEGADKDQKKASIAGEVKNPGAIPWAKGLTLMKAVAQTGGFTELANIKKVKMTRNGKATIYDLRLIKKEKGRDPEILSGDIIKVAARWW